MICATTLDNVALLKCIFKSKSSIVSPWITEIIRGLKRECGKTERQWKKSKLSVVYEHMNFLLQSYNSEIKDARAKYFSELITSNQHKPRFLFKTTHLVSPGSPGVPITSNADCERFLTFFIDKIEDI